MIPIAWILLEVTTILIMFGFYRKLKEETRAESSIGTNLIDHEIVYSHNSVSVGSSGS